MRRVRVLGATVQDHRPNLVTCVDAFFPHAGSAIASIFASYMKRFFILASNSRCELGFPRLGANAAQFNGEAPHSAMEGKHA
jgi:hypothetical protein